MLLHSEAGRGTSAELWLTAGGPHHTVLTGDVGTETLLDFARMVHTELLMIDADTTPAAFAVDLKSKGLLRSA